MQKNSTQEDALSIEMFLKVLQMAKAERVMPRINWDLLVLNLMTILTTEPLPKKIQNELWGIAAMAYKNSRNKQLDQLIIGAYKELQKSHDS